MFKNRKGPCLPWAAFGLSAKEPSKRYSPRVEKTAALHVFLYSGAARVPPQRWQHLLLSRAYFVLSPLTFELVPWPPVQMLTPNVVP